MSSPGKAVKSEAPLMLSVSGARGIVGQSMTPAVAADFAAAFGSFVKASHRAGLPLICVGRDGRPSGQGLAEAAMGGLLSVGCRVIDLGIVATPTVSVMIGRHSGAGGLVVTASHNPVEWNGIKCLNGAGAAPPPQDAEQIISRFRQRRFDYAEPAGAWGIVRDASANETHIARVLAAVDPRPIQDARFKVVLVSINGAGAVSGRMLLERLGCEVVQINSEPTGQFAHRPEPVEENLRDLANHTRRENAACGFAQDPDADRLAIVDETGRYIGEEYTLVLAAKRVLDLLSQNQSRDRQSRDRKGAVGRSAPQPIIIAANLSTSRMIDDLAAQYPDVKVVRTAVGEANVVAAMQAHGDRAIIGGEGNGGVIFPPVCWVRDSLSAMALVLDLLAASGLPFSALVNQLPRYVMIKHKFDLKESGEAGGGDMRTMLDRVARRFADEGVSTVDGVRVDFEDGWVHLRPSNTEPIIRLIAEARTDSRAWELIDEVAVAAGLK